MSDEKKLYWADVSINLSAYLEDIEAPDVESAKDAAYALAKSLLDSSKIANPIRPFGIRVVCAGQMKDEN